MNIVDGLGFEMVYKDVTGEQQQLSDMHELIIDLDSWISVSEGSVEIKNLNNVENKIPKVAGRIRSYVDSSDLKGLVKYANDMYDAFDSASNDVIEAYIDDNWEKLVDWYDTLSI